MPAIASLEDLKSAQRDGRSKFLIVTIDDKQNISTLFEIKPDLTPNSLQTGIGQLILNSIGLPKKVRLVLVIPKRLLKPIESRIEKIGIKCLTYKMTGKCVKFPDIKVIDEKNNHYE